MNNLLFDNFFVVIKDFSGAAADNAKAENGYVYHGKYFLSVMIPYHYNTSLRFVNIFTKKQTQKK